MLGIMIFNVIQMNLNAYSYRYSLTHTRPQLSRRRVLSSNKIRNARQCAHAATGNLDMIPSWSLEMTSTS